MFAAHKGARLLLSHLARHNLAVSSPAVLLGMLGLAPAVYAQVITFDIPAQPLGSALQAFGQQASVQVLYSPDLVVGKQSAKVAGTLDVAQGMRQLLTGSGLSYQVNGNTIVLVPPASANEVQLGVIDVTGQSLGATTEGSGSYTTNTVTVGKTAASLKETPQSVSVMTRQRMEDQSLTTFHDVLNQTPGVSVYQTSAHTSRYISRGSEITSYRIDGGPPTDLWSYGGGKELDMAMYDRVEVLRGADGLFSGAGEPGGSINLVRKRPTATPQLTLESSVASWNGYREMVDVSGPLAFDGKLKGRTVLVSNDSDMFYDKAHINTKFFYGVLQADVSDTTTVLLGATYNDYKKSDQVYGMVRGIEGQDLHLPRSTFLAGAKDRTDGYVQTYFFRIDQQLGDDWVAALDTMYAGDSNSAADYNFSGAVKDDGSGVSADYTYQTPKSYSKALDLNLKGNTNFLGLDHDIILGWDWTASSTYGNHYVGGGTRDIPNIYTFDPDDYLPPADRNYLYYDDQRIYQSGLYGSWRAHLTDAFSVTLGGRYGNYKSIYHYDDAEGTVEDTPFADRRVFTPFAGVAYDLTPEWTWYASASEIYKSQANYITSSRSPLDPITGRTYETGIKGELFGGRLTTAAAIYYTKREGQAVQLVRDGSNCCYSAGGEMVSKGIDLEVSGQIIDRLQATLAYNFNQVENTDKGSRTLDYNSLQPKHQLKLFASYQLTGWLANLKVGGGVTAQTTTSVQGAVYRRNAGGTYTLVTDSFAFDQAGYAIWNAFADYKINKNWDVSFNANNLFDKTYYSTVGRSGYGNFYGDPRNYVFTLRAKY